MSRNTMPYKVEIVGPHGCWRLNRKPVGHGRFLYTHITVNGKRVQAHRSTYEDVFGPVPSDHEFHHEVCENTWCCNPWHVKPMTKSEHAKISMTKMPHEAKGKHYREKTHCPKGHPYDEANTYHLPNGGRVCRQCRNEKTLAAYHQKRAEGWAPPKKAPKPRTAPVPRLACPNGHPYDEATTIDCRGKRRCATCHAAAGERLNAAKRKRRSERAAAIQQITGG